MKPPFKFNEEKIFGWSLCTGCDQWKKNRSFYHEGRIWILCIFCFTDYWENTDNLENDYNGYGQ